MVYLFMGIIIVFTLLWIVSTQRKLVIMDENINNSLSQIGVHLSSRWDALNALLELTKKYAEYEYETLTETIKARRAITKTSSAEDVVGQENMITEALGKIMAVAEDYPELKADQSFLRTMDAVDQYENMVRTSRLIYNDSVTKLNRSIRLFPTLIFSGVLGFHKRDYLEADESKTNMPSMR
ncbi:LemA family protein [Fusibacter sp. 3D3]|uniref:LemA family protein n=1 Tax=Fusibacter sp. 3D3 TaxID=1048380 RepID=UPI000853B69A|nr:LemA family protein [Fusibacter sp. 3D3]GAU79218.1 LemA protein [Fusibacter sp. 3D3]